MCGCIKEIEGIGDFVINYILHNSFAMGWGALVLIFALIGGIKKSIYDSGENKWQATTA